MANNSKQRRQKTGGKIATEVVYPSKCDLSDYVKEFNGGEQLSFTNGKKAPVNRWGSLFLYIPGIGGKYRLNQLKSKRGCWRLFNSNYDQLDRLKTQYDKAYMKSRKFVIDDLFGTVSAYRTNKWTDVEQFLISALCAGVEVHVVCDAKAMAILDNIVDAVYQKQFII